MSETSAEQMIKALLARWALQENQFKYGVERLGINQLDGRGTDRVPDELLAIIPPIVARSLVEISSGNDRP